MSEDERINGSGEPVSLFSRARPAPDAVVLPGPPLDMPDDAGPAMDPDEVARAELKALQQRHRDLDAAIDALAERGSDPLAVRRLKKRKLMLRDQIAAIEDRLTPDIIA